MKYSDKQILFESFLKEWGLKFNQMPSILNHISSYPELKSKLENFNPLSSESINESQLEWISLVSQFDREAEKVFFKPYWVPIQCDSYDYFIDLSSPSLSIFVAQYYFFEPYRWLKKYLFKNITEFLASVHNPSINLDSQLRANDEESRRERRRLHNERERLGFSGEILPALIEKDSLFEIGRRSSYRLNKETLRLSGIDSIGIGLLPFEEEITINRFRSELSYDKNAKREIKNVKALIFLIQSVRSANVKSYHVSFKSDINCYAKFEDKILTIRHTDKSLLEELIKKYKFYKSAKI